MMLTTNCYSHRTFNLEMSMNQTATDTEQSKPRPLVVVFRKDIDGEREVPNFRMTRMTSEAGRVTGYED